MELLRFAPLLAVAVLCGPATSQEKGTTTQASAETASTPAKKLEALKARFDKENQDAYDAYVKATTDDEKQKIIAGMPGKNYVPEIRAIAEEAAGTDTAAEAWVWVLRLGVDDTKERWGIIELLLTNHMSSAAMEEVAAHVAADVYGQGEARVLEALHAIADESTQESARAAALYSLGTVLLGSKEPSRKAEGRTCLESVVAKYPTVPRRDSTYKAAAEGFLFELDHLQIGMSAPDFQTVDENGAQWKLSDYKGKVVVVDFWGFW